MDVSDEVKRRFVHAVKALNASALHELLSAHPELRAILDEPLFDADQPAIVFARGNHAVVDVLLDYGADINARSSGAARSASSTTIRRPCATI